MQGQAHNIEDLGYPNVNRAGLGDDLINEFYNWRKRAFAAEGNPYFKKWGGKQPAAAAAPRQQTEGAAAATLRVGGRLPPRVAHREGHQLERQVLRTWPCSIRRCPAQFFFFQLFIRRH